MNQSDLQFARYDAILRIVALGNLLLIAISFTAWFSGTAGTSGVADRLFGGLRFAGWRVDVAWLLLTNVFLFFALLYSLVDFRRCAARLNAGFTLSALAAFYVYVHHLLHSGLLYMG